jgi:RNA polymerase sigma factor (sigma-70 family)
VRRRVTDPEDSLREEWAVAAYPFLYRRAWNLTRDTMSAQDLTQQAILQVLRRWPIGDGATRYAMRCLTNEFIDGHRRRRRRVEDLYAEPPERPSGEDLAGWVVDHLMLTQALARLTARQHVIVDYYLAGGMSFSEIGDLLGLSESTVHRGYQRALGVMREFLGQPHEERVS